MKLILCVILSFWSGLLFAQFGPQQTIANDADGAQSIFVADIDGDGFKDVVCANKFANSVTWYQNLDGDGNFGPQLVIDNIQEPIEVYVADLDGDNDMDVLATIPAPGWDQLVWYENLDGLGDFSNRIILYDGTVNGPGAFDVIAADMDGDDDMDVVMGSNFNGVWFIENLDGQGDFAQRVAVTSEVSLVRSVFAADIDGDLDLDLVSNGSFGDEELFWYENLDGQANFGPKNGLEPSAYVNQVFCADLDGDDDMDIATVIPGLNIVAWHENLDGQGSFSSEQIISSAVEFPYSVYVADLDNDTDFDIVSASANDNKIAWYENLDGAGNFSAQQVISTNPIGPVSVFAADLDNDGDQDVFSASQNDDTLAWYENLTILGVNDINAIPVTLVPNPVRDILHIKTEALITSILVNDVLGRKLLEQKGNKTSLEVSNLPKGLLFVTVTTDDGIGIQKVVKE